MQGDKMSQIYVTKLREDIVALAKHNNLILAIAIDQFAENPREWDNLGTMVCFHKRYILGDQNHGYRAEDFNSWDEVRDAIIKNENPVLIYPLYLFDHSGLTIQIGPFNGPDAVWDSGQVGYIYTTKDAIRKHYQTKRVTQRYIKLADTILREEVKIYDAYLKGEVYLFILEDKDGNLINSCGGFYGNDFDKNGIREHLGEYAYLLDYLEPVR